METSLQAGSWPMNGTKAFGGASLAGDELPSLCEQALSGVRPTASDLTRAAAANAGAATGAGGAPQPCAMWVITNCKIT